MCDTGHIAHIITLPHHHIGHIDHITTSASMAEYQIRELAHLTGVKAHTIRVWEQRYNLLSPDRGGRNIRSYSNEELKKLLL